MYGFSFGICRWRCIHGQRLAAEAGACVQMQNNEAFWRMHDYLFEHQDQLTADNLISKSVGFAGSLRGVRPERTRACLERHTTASRIQNDMALAAANHITGTPTVLVNGERAGSGAPTREHLLTLIREASQGAGPSRGAPLAPMAWP